MNITPGYISRTFLTQFKIIEDCGKIKDILVKVMGNSWRQGGNIDKKKYCTQVFDSQNPWKHSMHCNEKEGNRLVPQSLYELLLERLAFFAAAEETL